MKAIKIIPLAAVLVALFSYSFISAAEPGGERQGGKQRFIQELGLTDEQAEQLEDLRAAHQKQMADLKAELKKSMIDLRSLTSDADFTREEFLAQHEKVTQNRNAIADARANHMLDVYDKLTSEQREKFVEKMGQFGKHGKKGFRGRRGGGPDEPGFERRGHRHGRGYGNTVPEAEKDM